MELHARIMRSGQPLTETWIYRWTQGVTFRPLPEEAPLAMPTQSLRQAPARVGRMASSPRAMGLRRLMVIGSAIVLTGFAAREMYRVLAVNGVTPLAIFMLALFVALFAWIALSFTSAIAGFVSVIAGGGRRLLAARRPADQQNGAIDANL